jgi:ElaA protein
MSLTIADATFADLDATTLYAILALRSRVFVVEQNCVYLDPDGRDLEESARQVWATANGAIVATLRVLRDRAAWRIGRVVTDESRRSTGLAARLVEHALSITDGSVVLDAQSHLRAWYERFGFEVDGAEFIEDGIAHVPMRLDRAWS